MSRGARKTCEWWEDSDGVWWAGCDESFVFNEGGPAFNGLVPLVENAVLNHTDEGDVIYDPFLGSGTTIVAAERLGRLGRGVELEPRYVAVALQRLADMGLQPELA